VALEHEVSVAPAPPAVVASPERAGGAPLGAETVLSLQRTAGNQAVSRAIASGQIQRAPTKVGVTGVTVTPSRFTIPLEAGVSVTAKAAPANATGVTWTLKDGSATVTGSAIDAKTGAITVAAGQPGGTLKAEAKADDGSTFAMPFNVVEKPTTLASTASAATGTYAATFTHSFTGASGKGSGVERANFNEKFDALKVDTPFGPFTLQANEAGSAGWDLNSSGTMHRPDNVSIGQGAINANKFVTSASNPTPAKTLPVGFSMTQHLHAKSFPSGALDAAPFKDTDHVRNLEERDGALKVILKAGKGEVAINYAGPVVFRNAKASKTKVEASAPKPAVGAWKRNEVQVSITAEPAGADVKYSLVGEKLGCEVDVSGNVKIGDKAGTIKVRAGDGGKHFDEVSIEITARPAPPTAPKGTATDVDEAEPAMEEPVDQETATAH
jgi:hypothetical protein